MVSDVAAVKRDIADHRTFRLPPGAAKAICETYGIPRKSLYDRALTPPILRARLDVALLEASTLQLQPGAAEAIAAKHGLSIRTVRAYAHLGAVTTVRGAAADEPVNRPLLEAYVAALEAARAHLADLEYEAAVAEMEAAA